MKQTCIMTFIILSIRLETFGDENNPFAKPLRANLLIMIFAEGNYYEQKGWIICSFGLDSSLAHTMWHG